MQDEPNEGSKISLRAYLENRIVELGKRMDVQFLSAKEAIAAALQAQDKLTSAAFQAAKEQITELKTTVNDKFEAMNKRVTILEAADQSAKGEKVATHLGEDRRKWTFDKQLGVVGVIISVLTLILVFTRHAP